MGCKVLARRWHGVGDGPTLRLAGDEGCHEDSIVHSGSGRGGPRRGLGYALGHRTSTTTTTSSNWSTSSISSSTTTIAPARALSAVWPFAVRNQRFTGPLAVARSFAVDYLGFTNPVLDAHQAGDSRSGDVPLRPYAEGPLTTVLVRQNDASNTWWVLGCVSESLQIAQPGALEKVASPLRVSGHSTAHSHPSSRPPPLLARWG